MAFFGIVVAVLLSVWAFSVGARWVAGGRVRRRRVLRRPQPGEKALWPDRTGPRTRRELGAREVEPGIRREVQPGPHVNGPDEAGAHEVGLHGHGPHEVGPDEHSQRGHGQHKVGVQGQAPNGRGSQEESADRQPASGLDPEAEFGEDRPANRTEAPDAPPTQWHPEEHGVPGDHIRDGHHRSATAPERKSDATDPFAHAPVPGPNHVPPEGGAEFPPDIRP